MAARFAPGTDRTPARTLRDGSPRSSTSVGIHPESRQRGPAPAEESEDVGRHEPNRSGPSVALPVAGMGQFGWR